VCAFGAAEIEFCLFDGRRIPAFQIIGQAERSRPRSARDRSAAPAPKPQLRRRSVRAT
jgi:hypothetical protein